MQTAERDGERGFELTSVPEQSRLDMHIPPRRERPMSEILGGLSRLMDTAMDAEAVKALIEEHLQTRGPRSVILHAGDWVSPQVDGPLPRQFLRIYNLALAREEIMLVGPAGCGKTTVARKVAEALDLGFGHLTLTAGMSVGELVGRLLPTGEGGRYEYCVSRFVHFYEHGGVFLLDEMDASDENTLLVINTALANDTMAVPGRLDAPTATRHPDFVCIAAANTYGNGADRQYVGRNQLDAATLDRFRAGIITMDYDRHVEEARVSPEVLAWGTAMRGRIAESGLRRFVSTRFLVKATRLLGMRRASWAGLMDSYFADWSADERHKVGTLAPSAAYDPEQDLALIQGEA